MNFGAGFHIRHRNNTSESSLTVRREPGGSVDLDQGFCTSARYHRGDNIGILAA
jgi:hypothetical protein